MKNLGAQFFVNRELNTTMERLSSGLRINKGADDPTGLAMTESMRAHIGGIDVAVENAQDALSYMRARDSHMEEQLQIANRVYELAIRAANEATLTTADMQKLDDEANALITELDNIGKYGQLRSADGCNFGLNTLFHAGQLDVLWVIDQTGSMGGPIASVIAGAPQMFSEFKAKGFDLRMGAVGYGNAGILNPADVPPGGGVTTLTGTGTQTLQDTSLGFTGDVGAIAGNLAFGTEAGSEAILEGIYGTGVKAQLDARPDAQRVVILLTDTDDDSNGDSGFGSEDNTRNMTDLQRDYMIASLDAMNFAYFAVNSITEGGHAYPGLGQDADYTDVTSAVAAGGGAMNLDPAGAWVTTITDTLQAFGGPYSMQFQIGADNVGNDRLTLDFKTVTARTSGMSATLTSASSAQASIDSIKGAIDFIATERAQTGVYMKRVEHIVDDLVAEKLGTVAAKSRLKDTDFAVTASDMAKQQLIRNSAQAISVQANASPVVVLNLISEHGVGAHPLLEM